MLGSEVIMLDVQIQNDTATCHTHTAKLKPHAGVEPAALRLRVSRSTD